MKRSLVFLLLCAVDEYCAPAALSGISAASAVGIYCNFFHVRSSSQKKFNISEFFFLFSFPVSPQESLPVDQ